MGKDIEPKCSGCEKLLLVTNATGVSYAACRISKGDYKPLLCLQYEYAKWYNSNEGKNIKRWSEFESDYRPLWCPKCSLEALSKDLYETNKLACDIVSDNIMKEFKNSKNMSEIEGVNHPSHYNKGGIEAIDAMESAFGIDAVIAFCKCNAFKYQWRAGEKDGESYEKDIAKAQWYLNKATELMKKQPKKVSTQNGSQVVWGNEFATYAYVVCKKDYNPCRNIEFKEGNLYQLKSDEGVMYLLLDGCAFHTTQKVVDEYFDFNVKL